MKTRILHVGDVHAQLQDLLDCSRLCSFILEVAEQTKPDFICFMGDQYHTHAIMHVQVLEFWKTVFAALKKHGHKVTALLGNHDMSGNDTVTAHAMMAHTHEIRVIEKPTPYQGVLFMPYMSDHAAFLEACRQYRPPASDAEEIEWQADDIRHEICHTVVCHQTFNGSQYDNGFYAKDGLDPEQVPQQKIISGHIHSEQAFGKVFYVGSPRWQTLSDANLERNIWLITYENGVPVEQTPFSTGDVCRRIWHLVDTEAEPLIRTLDPGHQWRIDIKGTAEYVERRKKELAGPGVRIRTFVEQTSTLNQVRESEGVDIAFRKYVAKFEGRYGTPREVLESMARERLSL